MTFVNSQGANLEVFLPRKSLFIMSDESRYSWMHAIRLEDVTNRRVSITIRELSESFKKENEIMSNQILDTAKKFI
ncbi:unnamed protein product, partial [Phytomonas sp. Hart1]